MQKVLAGLFLSFFLLYNGGDAAAEAKAAFVMEAQSGRTLYAVHADTPLPMASTTKVMTALLAIESDQLQDRVTVSDRAVGTSGTSIYLRAGETMRLEQMLYGLMIASGNDAAVAIAEHLGGTVEGFVTLMNARAVELGLTQTVFQNPHGLPAVGHVTTARELAFLASVALEYPLFRAIVGTERISIPGPTPNTLRTLSNKNRLLWQYEGAIGVKTGFTRAAGRCLVFAAERQGMTLTGVVLGCPDWFDEATALLNACFAEYQWITLLTDGTTVATVPIIGGRDSEASLMLSGELGVPLKQGERAEVRFRLPDAVLAPLPAGAPVGEAVLFVDDIEITTRPLVLSAPAHLPPTAWERQMLFWPMW